MIPDWTTVGVFDIVDAFKWWLRMSEMSTKFVNKIFIILVMNKPIQIHACKYTQLPAELSFIWLIILLSK